QASCVHSYCVPVYSVLRRPPGSTFFPYTTLFRSVIGEAPGAEEDLRGEPFVGQAGRLLDSVLAAAGLGRTATGRSAVYIANVVKCRPPANRNPEPDEVVRCEPFLRRQIILLAPRVIVVMGRV